MSKTCVGIQLVFSFVLVHALSAQTPAVTTIVNRFSLAPALSPGVLALVNGSNFGTDATAVSVSVGGKAAYIFTAAPLTVQIPVDLAPGATTLVVTRSGASSSPANITLAAYAPGIAGVADRGAMDTAATTPASPKRGDLVTLTATGLGATNPPLATGVAATGTATCVTTPVVTLAGIAITPQSCAAAPKTATPLGGPGMYQVTFRVPDNIASGPQPVVLTSGGLSSPAGTVIRIAATAPTITSVVNAASLDKNAPIAPGSIVTISGSGFGSKDQLTGFSGSALQGVSVTMNGIPAPLLNLVATASTPQMNVVAPVGLPVQGTVPVVVLTADGQSQPFQASVAAASPGIFRSGYKNYGAVALVNPNWPAPDPAQALGITVNCAGGGSLAATNCGRAFRPGDVVQIYATGLGLATPGGDPNAPTLADGQLAPADGSVMYQTIAQPVVSIGGIPAQVSWAGLVPGLAGEYQVSVTIPAGVTPGDDVPLTLTLGDLSDSVSIAVSAP